MRKIKSIIISVYHKEKLEKVVDLLKGSSIEVYSTGGTKVYLEHYGLQPKSVESLTTYPSILGGRVKTLHPKIFGGILAKRTRDHNRELKYFDIPPFDMVVVDLYPFEEAMRKNSSVEEDIIENIDIGGISLIRAAAKNYKDVVVIPSIKEYSILEKILSTKEPHTTLDLRKTLAARAFQISSHYDQLISSYLNNTNTHNIFSLFNDKCTDLKYGENPHQKGQYFGNLEEIIQTLKGDQISYNNLIDLDAAVQLLSEFQTNSKTVFAILKHGNCCGLSIDQSLSSAYKKALQGDPISAFGGVLATNSRIDLETAEQINTLYYSMLLAKDYDDDALEVLRKKKRILIKLKQFPNTDSSYRSILNGTIVQSLDNIELKQSDVETMTSSSVNDEIKEELLFAFHCVKHLKSNAIAITKNFQLLGIGCGQTSRIDALQHAIDKAEN